MLEIEHYISHRLYRVNSTLYIFSQSYIVKNQYAARLIQLFAVYLVSRLQKSSAVKPTSFTLAKRSSS